MLHVNEYPVPFRQGMCMADLVADIKPDADILIVNGFPVADKAPLHDGDRCWLIKRGELPPAKEMDRLLHARHTPGVHDVMKKASVGIMGLGGLGSLVAVALARMGIGRLVLADYDVVEPSNLNRQQYFVDQIGMPKVTAMRASLSRVNPYVIVETVAEKLTRATLAGYFHTVDVLVECFDDAAMKAMAMRVARKELPALGYVGSSGVAGYDDNNTIWTKKIQPGVYVVGDGVSEAGPGQGLMAPRVGIAAHQQANQVVRILLGEDE